MSVPSLGIFIDGTKADWRGRRNTEGVFVPTAIKRLYLDYVGQKEYFGGPGTDTRGWWERLKGTLLGAGRGDRFTKIKIEIETWEPKVLDLYGWSRGADDVYEACDFVRLLGVPVRFLALIDPVPAFGLKAALRLIPFFPLQRSYKPPVNIIGGVAQVLAGEEHSRILRRAYVPGVPTFYIQGNHSDSGWRDTATDTFIKEQGRLYGVNSK